MKFENLKIEIKLASPIIANDDLCLDGVFSYLAMKKIFTHPTMSKMETVEACKLNNINNYKFIDGCMIDPCILLDEILDKKYKVYCSSYVIGKYKESITKFSKRFNTSLIDNCDKTKNSRADLGCGHFKACRLSFNIRSYAYPIKFYVRGDKIKIINLLDDLYFIGKKTGYGYGKIKDITIENTDNDYSIFKDKQLMRCIPMKNISLEELSNYADNKKHIVKMKTYKPPYWRKDAYELCYVPSINNKI